MRPPSMRMLLLRLSLLALLLCLRPQYGALASAKLTCRYSVVEGQAPINAAIDGPSLYSCMGVRGLREQPGDTWTLGPPPGWAGRPNGVWKLLKVGSNGSLQVARDIDREEPSLECYSQEVCPKRFTALLRNPSLNRFLKKELLLEIQDYNDNSPVFGQENRELKAVEGLQVQLLLLPSVTDLDAGKNGQTMTRIIGHDAPVTRHDTVENPSSAQPNLRLYPMLDYETVQSYNITLEACDNGKVKSPCSRIQVRIIVEDINDNQPRFEVKELRLPDVAEDAFKKSGLTRMPIGQVRASDLDSGDNGRIEYSLERGRGSRAFAVDAQTGTIYQIAHVNAALNPEIKLTIRAQDFGSSSRLQDLATVLIRFIDVNDHSPLVSLLNAGQPQLVEGKPNPKFANLEVSDGDLGQLGRVACGLDANSAAKFVLEPVAMDDDAALKQFSLSTRRGQMYDREVQASETLVIRCWDHGKPPRTSSLTLTASIVDVNEYPPVFNQTVVYDFMVAENQTAGQLVGKMTAYDRDATASISYSISDEDAAQGCFSINSSTGQIFTKRRLDREDPTLSLSGRPVYVVTVQASDGQFTATARVNIRILDINDNPPVLDGSSGVDKPLLVNESFGNEGVVGKFVGQLGYTDADESGHANSMASFSLVRALRSSPNLRFHVSFDGRVTASGVLDRETSPRPLLVVRLVDNGSPTRLTSTGTVAVQLLDLNDNPPKIWSPRPRQQLNLTEDTPPGVSFAEVNVTDADEECERRSSLDCLRSGGLRLRLERQAVKLFSVNSSSGQLMVANPLTQGLHRLNLSVTDRGRPGPLTSWVEFSVRVHPRADRGNQLLGGLLGGANNWTVLLVIVVASSFITVILVVAIVLLNRRQPCLGGGSSSGRSSGDSDDPDGGIGGGGGLGGGYKDAQHQLGYMMDGTMRSQHQQLLPPPPPPPPHQGAPLSPRNAGYHGQHGMMRQDQNGSSGAAYHPLPYGGALLPWQLAAGAEYDGASADSGHGASEEEIHGEQRGFMTLPVGTSRVRSPVGCSCSSIMEEDPMLPHHHQHQQQQQQQQQHCQQHENIPLTFSGAGCSTFTRNPVGSFSSRSHHQQQQQQQPLTLLDDPQFNQVKLSDHHRSTATGRSPNRLPPIAGSRSGTPQQPLLSLGSSPHHPFYSSSMDDRGGGGGGGGDEGGVGGGSSRTAVV